MYIVHIKITLHIQVLVYCKKCYCPLDYGPARNLSNLSTCVLPDFALAWSVMETINSRVVYLDIAPNAK